MYRLALVAALVVAPKPAAAYCISVQLHAQVVTKPGTEIPSDGGIVVATSWNQGDTKETTSADPVRPGWRLRGKQLTAPRIDVLAPGLAVYRVTFDGQAAMELEDEEHAVMARVTAGTAKTTAIPPPKVKSLVYMNTMSRHSSQIATATLTADPPAGALALVIVNAKGQPTSWGGVVPGRVQTPYEHQGCGALPNGSSAPGGTVTTFWVMADGRRSEPSKPIKVVQKISKSNRY